MLGDAMKKARTVLNKAKNLDAMIGPMLIGLSKRPFGHSMITCLSSDRKAIGVEADQLHKFWCELVALQKGGTHAPDNDIAPLQENTALLSEMVKLGEGGILKDCKVVS